MSLDVNTLITFAGMIAAGGVAWGGARAGASGTAQDLRDFKREFGEHCQGDAEIGRRVAHMEGRIEAIHGATVLKRREGDANL